VDYVAWSHQSLLAWSTIDPSPSWKKQQIAHVAKGPRSLREDMGAIRKSHWPLAGGCYLVLQILSSQLLARAHQ
jgi:hypothetical protein